MDTERLKPVQKEKKCRETVDDDKRRQVSFRDEALLDEKFCSFAHVSCIGGLRSIHDPVSDFCPCPYLFHA